MPQIISKTIFKSSLNVMFRIINKHNENIRTSFVKEQKSIVSIMNS